MTYDDITLNGRKQCHAKRWKLFEVRYFLYRSKTEKQDFMIKKRKWKTRPIGQRCVPCMRRSSSMSLQYSASLRAHMQRKSNDLPCQEKLLTVKIEKFRFFSGHDGGGGGSNAMVVGVIVVVVVAAAVVVAEARRCTLGWNWMKLTHLQKWTKYKMRREEKA